MLCVLLSFSGSCEGPAEAEEPVLDLPGKELSVDTSKAGYRKGTRGVKSLQNFKFSIRITDWRMAAMLRNECNLRFVGHFCKEEWLW